LSIGSNSKTIIRLSNKNVYYKGDIYLKRFRKHFTIKFYIMEHKDKIKQLILKQRNYARKLNREMKRKGILDIVSMSDSVTSRYMNILKNNGQIIIQDNLQKYAVKYAYAILEQSKLFGTMTNGMTETQIEEVALLWEAIENDCIKNK
jgi:hypothetical protein